MQVLLAVAAVVIPVILAAMARDRSLLTMIGQSKADYDKKVNAATRELHERINRVRDEFVRREDFYMQIEKVEKQIEGLREDLKTMVERTNNQYAEILRRLGHHGIDKIDKQR